MEKKREIELAKRRRAKLLTEHRRTECTQVKLAKKYGISSARVGFILKKARDEFNDGGE